MKILAVDYSYSKSGLAILSVKDGKPAIELAYLIKSNTAKTNHQRIDETVTEIKHVAEKNDIETILKEASIVGRSATATEVLKAHGVYEHILANKFELEDVHGASIKAFARKIIGKERADQIKKAEPKKYSKLVVKEAVEKVYGNVSEMYTPRGAYLDDVGDAILLGTLWLDRGGLVSVEFPEDETKNKRKRAK